MPWRSLQQGLPSAPCPSRRSWGSIVSPLAFRSEISPLRTRLRSSDLQCEGKHSPSVLPMPRPSKNQLRSLSEHFPGLHILNPFCTCPDPERHKCEGYPSFGTGGACRLHLGCCMEAPPHLYLAPLARCHWPSGLRPLRPSVIAYCSSLETPAPWSGHTS